MELALSKNTEGQNNMTLIALIVRFILAVAILGVFIRPGLSMVLGPVMAIIFSYLFFEDGSEFVTAVIITANDALGTVFLGKLSFQYLLLGLVLLKSLCMQKYTNRRLVFFLISSAFLLQLFSINFISFRIFVICLIYVISIISIDFDNPKAVEKFFKGIAFAVVLISIHAFLTGGVEFYELDAAERKSGELLRKGVLGVGTGNSNYSGILLNIGTISLWHFSRIKNLLKCLCTLPILYAMLLTNSLTGLIGLCVVIFVSIMLGEKKGKALLIFVAVIVVIVTLYNLYVDFPSEKRIPELDNYIFRIENTVDEFKVGDYNGVTTNRTNLAKKYLNYIFNEQSFFGMMFGGNSLQVESITKAVTHNTFINLLLQFGVIGTIIFLILIIIRFVKNYKSKANPNYKGIIVLKTFCVIAGLGASLYANNLWMLWMLGLILL